jgi:hypothetical protein
MRRTYAGLPNVTIEPLSIREQDLTTKRMMDLMAVKKSEAMPLYMHVVNRVLRDLRLRQQQTGESFDYRAFKAMLAREDLTDSQRVPLSQRLETLESFMAPPQEAVATQKKKKKAVVAVAKPPGNDWAPCTGQLTIVDLSCPCVTPEGACALFNICLSLFLEQDARRVGRIVALDEAHKYMNDSGEASALTEQLLATIRLQRHLGARVVISTQEPTVSPRLLDLCSVTVVHRFTSPEVSVTFLSQRIPDFHVLECSRMQHFRICSRTNATISVSIILLLLRIPRLSCFGMSQDASLQDP